MPTPGYVFKDGGPIPDDELSVKNSATGQTQDVVRTPSKPSSTFTTSPVNTPSSSRSAFNSATESHALANADHDEKGAAQNGHNESEVKDLGWNENPDDVPKPLVGGLPNEELWLLVRRFNKVFMPVFDTSTLLKISRSKYTMSKQWTRLLREDSISILQMRMTFRQISYGQMLRDYT